MAAYDISCWKKDIIVFTITREEKRNAVNDEVMEGLRLAIKMAKEPWVKGLVITGEGEKAFCSGGDLSVFHKLKTEAQAYQMLSKMGFILYELLVLPKLTIAFMNGVSVGGGCEIAAACDLRVAKNGIVAGFIQGNLAITTGWGGGTIVMEKLTDANALKILMEAKLYDVQELKNLGFIQYTCNEPSREALSDVLDSILMKEADVLHAYKMMSIRKWEAHSIKQKIEEEIRQCAVLWEREAHQMEVLKFMEK